VCGCGFETTKSGNASRHKKVSCGHEIKVETKNFVLETDHLEVLAKASGDVTHLGGEHNVNVNVVDKSTTNISLVLPEHTTKEDFILYLETLNGIGYRSDEQIMQMPGKLLMNLRNPNTVSGALVKRKNAIVEKLPDGSERVMPKKKAAKVYTCEAIDALCLRSPDPSVDTFLEKERGNVRQKMSVSMAAKLRLNDPPKYHNRVPADAKAIINKMENTTEKYLDEITSTNKDHGFL